jgi:ubiquinone/menaquinone biosynthesis C-methylase UbiE
LSTSTSGSDLQAYKLLDSASYDDVTESFESLTDRFTRPIARRLAEIAKLGRGERVLDVGCGTGVVTRHAAQLVGETGHVIGVDLSQGMLRKAQDLLAADGLEARVTLQHGDAERIALPDASVDKVVSLYALRHFPNPVQALREMKRLVRVGGRITVAVGSGPALGSADFIRSAAVKVKERVFTRPAPLYATAFLDGLLDRFLPPPSAEQLAAWEQTHHHANASVPTLMREAGLAKITTFWSGQSSQIATAEEFWTLQVTLSSEARKRIAAASPTDRDRLRKEFHRLCTPHLGKGGQLIYRSGALIVTAERPDTI